MLKVGVGGGWAEKFLSSFSVEGGRHNKFPHFKWGETFCEGRGHKKFLTHNFHIL